MGTTIVALIEGVINKIQLKEGILVNIVDLVLIM